MSPPVLLLILALSSGPLGTKDLSRDRANTHENLPGWEFTKAVQAEDGESGIAIFPARYSGERPTEILDPAGFELHMTNADDPGEELVRPVGELFLPPAGRFRIWLQSDSSMSPFTDLIAASGRKPPAGTKTLQTMPVIPAGKVKLDDGVPKDLQLRLLYAGWNSAANGPRHELSRRRPVHEVRSGVLMPEGKSVAALWDQQTERYVALSRPFQVIANSTVIAPVEAPDLNRAQLVVFLDRPRRTSVSAALGITPSLRQGDEEYLPDLVIVTSWGLYSLWYDLQPGLFALHAANEKLHLKPTDVRLSAGKISRFQTMLSAGATTSSSKRSD